MLPLLFQSLYVYGLRGLYDWVVDLTYKINPVARAA